jgi:hypothetical protein
LLLRSIHVCSVVSACAALLLLAARAGGDQKAFTPPTSKHHNHHRHHNHPKTTPTTNAELKAAKMETNRKTLVAMSRALNAGGALIWIAPSGGRDRPNADDVWAPDCFDPTAVELFRSLIARAKVWWLGICCWCCCVCLCVVVVGWCGVVVVAVFENACTGSIVTPHPHLCRRFRTHLPPHRPRPQLLKHHTKTTVLCCCCCVCVCVVVGLLAVVVRSWLWW